MKLSLANVPDDLLYTAAYNAIRDYRTVHGVNPDVLEITPDDLLRINASYRDTTRRTDPLSEVFGVPFRVVSETKR
ncbi:hypothetical protein [Chitinasiproducens palmae]|uniref:Uncharacterized protein n=1 Tax=Chitinasiproducens palmae TaxID=1770053 RepID=A0A1H2PQU7_9BURK|nr:hypothetical protein [Chitinasiproducens palmae]SDV49217.1 hypothetical protein SAMN05216551_107160 [Chitinasiproducens palmae]